jgi:hypothetical protein
MILIAGASLPLVVGCAGLATDTIQWTLWKRELQRAADSAAIAGVYDRELQDGETTGTDTVVAHDLTLNLHTGFALKSTYPKVSYPADDGDMINQVRVELAVQRSLPFSSLFMSAAPTITANATAASVPGTGTPCVLATTESTTESGIEISGNAEVSMPGCEGHSNGSSTNSALAKGSAKATFKAISAVGGIAQSSNWTVNNYRPYSPKLEDPFKDVVVTPSEMKCAGHWESKGKNKPPEWVYDQLTEGTDMANATYLDGNGNAVKGANCWKSMSVGASGALAVPDNFGPVYIDGGNANVQGDLSCTGCTIVLTNSDPSPDAEIGDFSVNSGSKINITAPTDGNFKGLAIYQDRRAESGSSNVNKINGNSGSQITGALYFPNQKLQYNGTGGTAATCTMFVALVIEFSGNSGTNNFNSIEDCAHTGLPHDNGTRMVRLIA